MTAKSSPINYAKNPRRAVCKLGIVAIAIAFVLILLTLILKSSPLDQLKFNLSLGSLIAIVLMINVISALAFVLLYAAYHWVRRDLKAPRSEDLADLQD